MVLLLTFNKEIALDYVHTHLILFLLTSHDHIALLK